MQCRRRKRWYRPARIAATAAVRDRSRTSLPCLSRPQPGSAAPRGGSAWSCARCFAQQFQEFIVAAHIVAGVVRFRSEYQQHRVRAVFVLNSPYQRRQMDAEISTIEFEFLAAGSVVGDDRATATDAQQKLMASAMRVFTASLHAGYVVNQEIAFDLKRDVARELSGAQAAAKILGMFESVQGDSTHLGGDEPRSRWKCHRCWRVGLRRAVDVANDACGIADNDGIRRHRTGNYCAGANHRMPAD